MAYESGRSQRCSRQSIRTLRPGSGCSRRTGTMADERDLKLVVNDAPIDNCGAGRRGASAGRSGESHDPSRGPSDAEATLRKLTIFDDAKGRKPRGTRHWYVMSFFEQSPGRSRGIGVHGYLGMVSTCRTVASCVSVGGANRACAAEAQVDAEEDFVEVALHVHGERRADERGDEEVSVLEEDVVVLDPH